jgi:hypothetical protein
MAQARLAEALAATQLLEKAEQYLLQPDQTGHYHRPSPTGHYHLYSQREAALREVLA